MNLIHRIAVYKDGKFDHYARLDELCWLRINHNGNVEMLNDQYGDIESGITIEYAWLDVSDTHKVEWGYILPHIGRVYVNDIIGYADHDSSYNEHIGTFAMDVMYWGYNRGQYATGKVIGNIHETPNCCHGRTNHARTTT